MKRRVPGRGEIVELVSLTERGLHAHEIATRLGVREGAYPKLLEQLERLNLDGVLIRLPGNRFKAQHSESDPQEGWEGLFSMNPRGFGFVNAAGKDDLYIAPDGIGGAIHGDRVSAMVVGRTSRGLEGQVIAILQRKATRIAGVLMRRGKSVWLEPDDGRIRGPIVLGREALDFPNGSSAVVEITRYPAFPEENPEGSVVEVLGAPGDPLSEVRKILVREQIVEAHSAEVVADAEAANHHAERAMQEARLDLRGIPLPTIDPEDARDHDDAVWVERMGTGYRAYVAIADVSEFVRPGSALDNEAIRRGCSIYLPDRAIPMLPPLLSRDACSLLAGQERLCLCVVAEIDSHGTVRGFEVAEGLMKSQAALTYGEVARVLEFIGEGEVSPAAQELRPGLAVLDELAGKLRAIRLQRGALDLDLPEPKIILDPETGGPLGITRRTQNPGVKRAYQMIEELMLLANELVAQWLGARKLPTVYRVHGEPDQNKLERLADVCERLGVTLDLEELLEPNGVGRWLKEIEDHPRRQALSMLLLRSLKQANYQVENIGHFGLASEAYLHFTSPIRRYPDLLVHRGVKAALRGHVAPVPVAPLGEGEAAPEGRRKRAKDAATARSKTKGKAIKPLALRKAERAPKPTAPTSRAIEELNAAATQASERERAAAEIEREVVDLYRALYMRGHIGERFEGTVTGLVGSGLFVCLDDPFVDVLIRLEELGTDQYELSDDQLAIFGVRSGERFSLGDRLKVEISDVALLRRTVYARRIVEASDATLATPGRKRTKEEAREERRGLKKGPKGNRGKDEKKGRRADQANHPKKPSKRGRADDSKPGKPGKPGKLGKAKAGLAKPKKSKKALRNKAKRKAS